MVLLSVIVCCLLAVAAATDVRQCSGRNMPGLKDSVQLSPCKKAPCKLKKGSNQHITALFTPENDIPNIKNHVTANVFGVELPFLGVDGNSICDKIFTEDEKPAPCPLKAGTKYMYKDFFPIHSIYPAIELQVHWALQDGSKDILCFEIPARIV